MDRIDLVNAIWNVSASDAEWLQELATVFGAIVPRSAAATAFTGTFGTSGFSVGHARSVVDDAALEQIVAAIVSAPSDAVARTIRLSPDGLVAFRTGERERGRHHEEFVDALRRHDARDALTVGAVESDGTCSVLTVAEAHSRRLGAHEGRAWLRVAAHMGAAARLRRRARREPLRDFDVLLEDGGRVAAAADGLSPDAGLRELLQHAVECTQRAERLNDLGHGDDAFALREPIWAGRWSVVDVWDSDGRRYYAALENPPVGVDSRTLTQREQDVLSRCSGDVALKVVGAELGLSESVVSRHLSSGLRKLGLPTRGDLIRANAARRMLVRLERARDPHLGESGRPPVQLLMSEPRAEVLRALSPAERRIASLLLLNREDSEIASETGVSVRTVSNHTASIFRKLGVGSRAQLAVLLAGQLQP